MLGKTQGKTCQMSTTLRGFVRIPIFGIHISHHFKALTKSTETAAASQWMFIWSLGMASSSAASEKSTKKRLPETLVELVDVAIYSFACQSGLRSKHKVRGDPVLEGVASFFGQLLLTAKGETLAEFRSISEARLGGWAPGEMPTKELLTFISSRIKTKKSKQIIQEDGNPEVPDRLVAKLERFDEGKERVVTRFKSKCWRCGLRCEFCHQKKKYRKFGDFRVE